VPENVDFSRKNALFHGVQFPSSPPKSANPNSVFFIKHTFGFVYRIENAD